MYYISFTTYKKYFSVLDEERVDDQYVATPPPLYQEKLDWEQFATATTSTQCVVETTHSTHL